MFAVTLVVLFFFAIGIAASSEETHMRQPGEADRSAALLSASINTSPVFLPTAVP